MEMLAAESGLPVGDESHFVFTLQGKNDLYTNFEQVLFKDPGDPLRFSHPAEHELASEFEEQMTQLLREYKGDKDYLTPHHPETADGRDYAPDSTALSLLRASQQFVGEILFG